MVDIVIGTDETRDERLDMAGSDTLSVQGIFRVGDEDETVRFEAPVQGAEISNAGRILNVAEEGRAIRFKEEIGDTLVASISNEGLIRSNDDAVQIQEGTLSSGLLSVNNAQGARIVSHDGQALDFADAGGAFRIRIDNAGVIASGQNDGLKLGAHADLVNSGDIFGGRTGGYSDGADGVSFEDEATGRVENSGRIVGDRHGVDAGEDSVITVVNEAGGRLVGHNGSGIGSDGSATVVNRGVIIGAFADAEGSDTHGSTVGEEDGGGPDGVNDGDGDGVDIDFLADIVNYGIIRGAGAGGTGSDGYSNTAEGIAAGGGVIRNLGDGEITGAGLGILIDDSSRGDAPFVTRIVNEGTITGGSSTAIKIVSALDDVIVNSGRIAGGDGVAIEFGSGDNRLAIRDGSEIDGISRGGEGSDTLDYRGFASGVSVDLSEGAATGADGVEGFEVVVGSRQGDTLIGDDADNRLVGRAGADVLDGGAGADTLVGGRGADVFRFSVAPQGDVDRIGDFASGKDGFELAATAFEGLVAGEFDAAAFEIGSAATKAETRIVYDSATGSLLFDADGSGAGEGVAFARLEAAAAVAASDFTVI